MGKIYIYSIHYCYYGQSEANSIPEMKGLVLKGWAKGGIIDLGKGKDVYSIHANNDFIRFEVDVDYQVLLDVSYEFEAESDVLPLNKNHTNIYNGHSNQTPTFWTID